jgi:hypothetical protein
MYEERKMKQPYVQNMLKYNTKGRVQGRMDLSVTNVLRWNESSLMS